MLSRGRGGGGASSKPQSLISRDFPSNFSCSIFLFCFLFLAFEASPNSSCDIVVEQVGERGLEEGYEGLLPVFLLVIFYSDKNRI